MAGQPGIFDADDGLRWLSASGDLLEGLRAVVASEAFRTELEAVLARTARSRGRRPQGSPWRSRARGTAGLVFLFLRACRIALPEATALALLYAVIGAQLFTAIVTESYGFTLCKHPLPDLAAAQ